MPIANKSSGYLSSISSLDSIDRTLVIKNGYRPEFLANSDSTMDTAMRDWYCNTDTEKPVKRGKMYYFLTSLAYIMIIVILLFLLYNIITIHFLKKGGLSPDPDNSKQDMNY